MAEKGCASCRFRARYDKDPRSILGRIWRWHINWCPGWRSYIKSLPEDEKAKIVAEYKLEA